MRNPCSPKLETDGLIYFPRLCDKIRLKESGELPQDYHANLGIGMDLWTCQFLGVEYDELSRQIATGASDEEALEWAREHGIQRTDAESAWWRSYMLNRGFRDDLAERLAQRKVESGLSERDDIQSFMDYIDADEGR
jgi:gluconokinase